MSLDESYATRNALVHALREDLQGPRESHERLTDTPFETYVSGVLYPADAKRSAAEEHPDDDFDGEVAPIEQAVWDPTVNLANSHYPSSMGMTFAAKSDDSIPVVITVSAARYEFDSKDEVDTWVRKPIEIAPHELSLKTPGTSVTELEAGLELYTNVREADTDGVASVTVAVINRRNAPPRERDADCYFQVALEATADGRPAFLDRTYKDDEISDPDLESYRLLYRDHRQYATGHGTAVEWEESDANEGAIRLTTTPIPAHELLLADSNPDIPSSGLGMLHLAECQQQELVNSLESLANSYSEWITNESERIDSLPDSLRGTASAHLTECSDACERMRAGIRGLSSNPSAMRAFRLANRAMLGQRARARWVAEGQPDGGPAEDESHVWRPFQIAFILVNLSSIIDPKSEDREVLDLLWFPTGGGKTEAYLGLIAFTILLRRLRGGSAGGAGVTVIMRYTLRLLTIQQFDRAAGLICALEQIRRNEDDLGTDEISLGLWVGRDGTPKNVTDAGRALDRLRQGLPVNTGNPMQLRACPWCGTILSP
ncbi:MAG: DNA helicase, partial [Actinomycetes bacterium]